MTVLDPVEAYRLWSGTYDSDPNPILALEHRVLCGRLALSPSTLVLDLGTGTGRWLEYVLAQGGRGIGVDLSPQMLARAAPKTAGRLVQATLTALPFPDTVADLAICSFTLAYIASPREAFREMARTARRVIVSDLHPEAVRAGWVRSFRGHGRKYEIAHHDHSQCLLNDSAQATGLVRQWSIEASFEEPERHIFKRAGRSEAFETVSKIPAILVSCWARL